jgi:formate dehydrogenase accessory protein FdhE
MKSRAMDSRAMETHAGGANGTHGAQGSALAQPADRWRARRRRAVQLCDRLPYAAEMLGLYQRLLDAQAPVHAAATADRPAMAELAAYVTRRAAPAIVAATAAGGPAALAAAAGPWLCERAAADVARWLDGEELAPVDAYFARAAAAPVLEALAHCGMLADGAPAAGTGAPGHCPWCGGLPQVAFTADAGDALRTGPRQLLCARCSTTWPAPRLQCAACGESATAMLEAFADAERLPHLRLDACRSCRTYVVHVDLRRDREAVPEVDELAAVPLDLHVQEQGLRKIIPNVFGIG